MSYDNLDKILDGLKNYDLILFVGNNSTEIKSSTQSVALFNSLTSKDFSNSAFKLEKINLTSENQKFIFYALRKKAV